MAWCYDAAGVAGNCCSDYDCSLDEVRLLPVGGVEQDLQLREDVLEVLIRLPIMDHKHIRRLLLNVDHKRTRAYVGQWCGG